jgi:hypothetical protein
MPLGLRLGAFIIGICKDLFPGERVDGGRPVHRIMSIAGGSRWGWTCAAGWDRVGPHGYLFGTPEIVAEKIYRMTQFVGITYLNCTFNIGQIPHQKIMRSMELFATKVMPHFRGYMPDQAKYPRQANAPDPKGYFAWEEGMPLTFA